MVRNKHNTPVIFGADDFIIPAMIAILGVLTFAGGWLEKGEKM